MTTKTITVTERAYDALSSLKGINESFSETILRVSGKRSLREFTGILSESEAKQLEKSIKENRKRHTESYKQRLTSIVKELKSA